MAKELAAKYRTNPKAGVPIKPTIPPVLPVLSPPPKKVPISKEDNPIAKKGGSSGHKKTLQVLSGDESNRLAQVEKERQRRQLASRRRCRYCNVFVQYPYSVNKTTEKTIWQMHLDSKAHLKEVKRYGQRWSSKCDACGKKFDSLEDWNLHIQSKSHRDAMNSYKGGGYLVE